MYAGESPVVHLVGIEGEPGIGAEANLKLEHFALSATGFAESRAHLIAMNVKYQPAELRDFNLVLINVWDPDGNHIHVDFPADE